MIFLRSAGQAAQDKSTINWIEKLVVSSQIRFPVFWQFSSHEATFYRHERPSSTIAQCSISAKCVLNFYLQMNEIQKIMLRWNKKRKTDFIQLTRQRPKPK